MLSRDNTSGKTVRRNVSSVSGQNAAEFHIKPLVNRLDGEDGVDRVVDELVRDLGVDRKDAPSLPASS